MGQYYNPVISSPDTLALNIDAASTRCYPGTGNTCYDRVIVLSHQYPNLLLVA